MNWKVRIAKRAVDIVGSVIGLCVAVPLVPVIAAAIMVDSKGPVLFRQRRAGSLVGTERANGHQIYRFTEFDVLKFRVLREDVLDEVCGE